MAGAGMRGRGATGIVTEIIGGEPFGDSSFGSFSKSYQR